MQTIFQIICLFRDTSRSVGGCYVVTMEAISASSYYQSTCSFESLFGVETFSVIIFFLCFFWGFHPALDWHILHGLSACVKENMFPYFFPTGFLGFLYWAGVHQSMPLDCTQFLYISRVKIGTSRKHRRRVSFCKRQARLLTRVSPSCFWFVRSLPWWACQGDWLKRDCW